MQNGSNKKSLFHSMYQKINKLPLEDHEKVTLESTLIEKIYREFRRNIIVNKADTDTSKFQPYCFARHLIQDILQTNEYTAPGIAYYTQIPEDVILDILSGINNNPSYHVVRSLIGLHSSLKPCLYFEMIKKITF